MLDRAGGPPSSPQDPRPILQPRSVAGFLGTAFHLCLICHSSRVSPRTPADNAPFDQLLEACNSYEVIAP